MRTILFKRCRTGTLADSASHEPSRLGPFGSRGCHRRGPHARCHPQGRASLQQGETGRPAASPPGTQRPESAPHGDEATTALLGVAARSSRRRPLERAEGGAAGIRVRGYPRERRHGLAVPAQARVHAPGSPSPAQRNRHGGGEEDLEKICCKSRSGFSPCSIRTRTSKRGSRMRPGLG